MRRIVRNNPRLGNCSRHCPTSCIPAAVLRPISSIPGLGCGLLDPVPELDSWSVRCAVRTLRAGGVVAYPTEAVYGLGCDPFNEHAVLRLLAIKGRAVHKGLILIAADHDQLEPLLLPCCDDTLAQVLESWPGPSTWILPAHPRVPVWLTGGSGGIAVRVTAHPLAASLCRRLGGPLISTSANRSGRPPARTVLRARRALGSRVDYFLTGPTGGAPRPSEIRDARNGRLLRGAEAGAGQP